MFFHPLLILLTYLHLLFLFPYFWLFTHHFSPHSSFHLFSFFSFSVLHNGVLAVVLGPCGPQVPGPPWLDRWGTILPVVCRISNSSSSNQICVLLPQVALGKEPWGSLFYRMTWAQPYILSRVAGIQSLHKSCKSNPKALWGYLARG